MSTYWIIIAGSAAVCFALMAAGKNRFGLKWKTTLWFGALAVPLALLGGRAMYFLVSLDWVIDRGLPFWRFTEGQFMLYGAVLGGCIAAAIAAKIGKQPVLSVMDAAALSAVLMIAAERFSEYLIGMGYGVGIEEWFDPYEEWSLIAWENPEFLYRFPFGMQNYYGTWRFAVNMLEELWALVSAAILLGMRKREKGAAASLLLILYAAGQIVLETMRRDEVLKWSFVQVNQLLSAVFLLLLLIALWRKAPAERRTAKRLLVSGGLLVFLALVVMLMEFALDQKIAFLFWMRADLSYLTDILCCIGMGCILRPLWAEAFPRIQNGAKEGAPI